MSYIDKGLPKGPGGFSNPDKSDIGYWSKRAWAHSYHSPAPPHGTEHVGGKNHEGESDYLPRVRREA